MMFVEACGKLVEACGYRERAASSSKTECDIERSSESGTSGSDQEDAFIYVQQHIYVSHK